MTGYWKIDINKINNIDEPFIVTLSPKILSDSYHFSWMLQPIFLRHMNVIHPYRPPAFIPLATSMDDSGKELTSIPSLDGTVRSQEKSHASDKATKS